MRILVVMPTAKDVYPAEAEQRRIKVITSYATPQTEIAVGWPEPTLFKTFGGLRVPHHQLEIAQNQIAVGQRMIEAEKEGFDACVPFGMPDFGVDIARSHCTIPIVGQAQACYATAAMMVSYAGAICYVSGSHPHLRRQIVNYGFERLIVGLGAAEIPNTQMPSRRDELFERVVNEGRRLVNDGAELIIMHGPSICPIEFPPGAYAEAIGVPVLEGVGCGIAMAEAWVRLGTPYSRRRHPAPEGIG